MNLIIEAGGTKTNISCVSQGQIVSVLDETGINFSRTQAADWELVFRKWSSLFTDPVQKVFVFGAGLTPHLQQAVAPVVATVFGLPSSHIFLYADIYAAAFASVADGEGIVGILGTGSASAHFQHGRLMSSLSSGGFILGDEGGGADLGKHFLLDFLRNKLPQDILYTLQQEYKLTPAMVIQQLYNTGTLSSATAFCAGWAPFLSKNLSHPYIYNLVMQRMKVFAHLLSTYQSATGQVFLVGSVAFEFSEIIGKSLNDFKLTLSKVVRHPIRPLSLYLAAKYDL